MNRIGQDQETESKKGKAMSALLPRRDETAVVRDFLIPLMSGGLAVIKAPVPMSQSDFDQITGTLGAWKAALVREPTKPSDDGCLDLSGSDTVWKSFHELDPEIAELVERLNALGFPTIGSCQGGPGHAFRLPTVQIRREGDLDETRKALCAALIENGIEGFTVKTVSMHQRSAVPEPYSYVEVELWPLLAASG